MSYSLKKTLQVLLDQVRLYLFPLFHFHRVRQVRKYHSEERAKQVNKEQVWNFISHRWKYNFQLQNSVSWRIHRCWSNSCSTSSSWNECLLFTRIQNLPSTCEAADCVAGFPWDFCLCPNTSWWAIVGINIFKKHSFSVYLLSSLRASFGSHS